MDATSTASQASLDPIVLVGANFKYTFVAVPKAEALVHAKLAYRDALAAARIDSTARKFISRIPLYQEQHKQHLPSTHTFHDIPAATRRDILAVALHNRPPVVHFICQLIRNTHVVEEMAAIDAVGSEFVEWYQRLGGVHDEEGILLVAAGVKACHRARNAEKAVKDIAKLPRQQMEAQELELRRQELVSVREGGRDEWKWEAKRPSKRLRTV